MSDPGKAWQDKKVFPDVVFVKELGEWTAYLGIIVDPDSHCATQSQECTDVMD